MSYSAQDLSYVKTCYKLSEFISHEKALELLKKSINITAERSSEKFKTGLNYLELSSLEHEVVYAPTYRIFSKGSFEWDETVCYKGGNAVVGNYYYSEKERRTQKGDVDFDIDDSVYEGLSLNLSSYKKDERKTLIPITVDEAQTLNLEYPALSTKQIATRISEQAKRSHKGIYNISDISIYLILTPLLKFTYYYEGKAYIFYVDLYDGQVDDLDVDTKSCIIETFKKAEKAEKAIRYTKFGIFGLLILDLIIAIFKGSRLNGTDLPSFIVLWIFVSGITALLNIWPWKKLSSIWTEFSEYYEVDDKYIDNNGKITFKTIILLVVLAIQIIVSLFLVIFPTVFALQ